MAQDRFGIDARAVLIRDTAIQDLEPYALATSRRLGIGVREAGQGLLIVMNYATRQMRIEVGPRLQGVFPDAFIAYLMRAHLDHFTDPAHAELGLRSLFHLLHHQALVAVTHAEWDPSILERLRDSTRLANGGGATMRMSGAPQDREGLPHSIKELFGPQPSPEALLDAYRVWILQEPIDTDVGIFTQRSRIAMEGTPYTRPFQDVEWWKYHGRPFVFVVRDSLAIAHTRSSAIIPPTLMRRSTTGWQIDVVADWEHVLPSFAGRFSWGWLPREDEWDSAFADLFEEAGDGLYRLRDGNNTPLPVRRTRWR